MRSTLILALLCAPPALADGLPSTEAFDARLSKCAPKHKYGKIKAVARLADGETIQAQTTRGKKILFTTPTGDACHTVFPIDRATARIRGSFDPAGALTKAFTMSQPPASCPKDTSGGCSQLLVLKDKAGAYRAARVLEICHTPSLKKAPLFGKRHHGVIVHCKLANDLHREHLFGFDGVKLEQMADAILGFAESALGAPETAKRPDSGARCEIAPPGLLKIVSYGPKPVVITRDADPLDPKTYDTLEGKVRHRRLAWDGTKFVRSGEKILDAERKIICHD